MQSSTQSASILSVINVICCIDISLRIISLLLELCVCLFQIQGSVFCKPSGYHFFTAVAACLSVYHSHITKVTNYKCSLLLIDFFFCLN